MNTYPWLQFIILWAAGAISALMVLPYAFKMNPMLQKAPIPKNKLMLISGLQSVILTGIASGLGLLLAGKVGLQVPLLDALLNGEAVLPLLTDRLLPALLIGGGLTFAMLLVEVYVFWPRLPQALKETASIPNVGDKFLAAFYGAIGEELLSRLFVMSGLAWLLGLVWQTPQGTPADGTFWVAIVVSTVIFGLSHLPAVAAITPITPLLLVRTVLLNGMALGFGYLFWQYGLETAMIAHFIADIVLHILSVMLFKQLRVKPAATAQATAQ